MATDKETVTWIVDQLAPLDVRSKAMFGEYCLYLDGKPVAFVCDNTLFIKPTAIANEYLSDEHHGLPYPRAKPHFTVPEDRIEDREWLQAFVQRTADALPAPKPKRPKK